jgi:pimeloyl-ACP methyl ester carboxylesterase
MSTTELTRRTLFGSAMTGAAALGGFATPASAQTGGKTFVLVHGAWHGGWCWRRVADQLQGKGHKVYAPTLTGLGERSHLMSALITLDTHITDVVNVIMWEDLDNIVLVGHSYAGFVISGVAERAQRSIDSIVFVDAFLPDNGQRVIDLRPDLKAATLAAAGKNEVTRSTGQIIWRERKGPAMGRRQDDPTANLGMVAAHRAFGRTQQGSKKNLHPGDRLPFGDFRNAFSNVEI